MEAIALRRIGILRLSAIGDVIHSLPLAMGLRAAFPEARITWVVQSASAALLRGHPAVDDLLEFPRRGGPGAWLRFRRELKERHFDATVDPQGNIKSGMVGWLSGAPLRAGLARQQCKERLNTLFTNRRGGTPRTPHGVDRAWSAAEPLGVSPGEDRWGLCAAPEELEAWRDRCALAGIDADAPILAMHLTDPEDARSWFEEEWKETANGATQLGYQVVLNGGVERRAMAMRIAGENPRIFDLTGRDDLRGLLAQYAAMAAVPGHLVLSPDSGPLHLAVAMGTPVICLSGPQDPARTGPRVGAVVQAWEGLACAPCLERHCIRRPPDRACMRRISSRAIVDALSARDDRGPERKH